MSFRPNMRATSQVLLLFAGLSLPGGVALAQAGSSYSVTGSIGASAYVMPVASFEGGAVRTLSITLAPGDSARVDPRDGVRTRMRYVVATRVTVSATPFQGPKGFSVTPRLLCSHGAAGESAPVASDVGFDCTAGYTAPVSGAGTSVVNLGVGAAVSASATRGLPPGLYTGELTLVATASGY